MNKRIKICISKNDSYWGSEFNKALINRFLIKSGYSEYTLISPKFHEEIEGDVFLLSGDAPIVTSGKYYVMMHMDYYTETLRSRDQGNNQILVCIYKELADRLSRSGFNNFLILDGLTYVIPNLPKHNPDPKSIFCYNYYISNVKECLDIVKDLPYQVHCPTSREYTTALHQSNVIFYPFLDKKSMYEIMSKCKYFLTTQYHTFSITAYEAHQIGLEVLSLDFNSHIPHFDKTFKSKNELRRYLEVQYFVDNGRYKTINKLKSIRTIH